MLLRGILAAALLGACSDDGGGLADGAADQTRWDGQVADGVVLDGGAGCATSAAMLSQVDPSRMLKDLQFLVGLGERRTYLGQRKAADYLKSQLAVLPGVALREQSYTYQGQTYVNLEATIAGTELPGEYVFAGAHYDSASSDPVKAPGADDDASGTVAILELARVLGGCHPRRSVRLLLFSNEEQGIIGSTSYVSSIKASVPPSSVVGFLSVDMVAFGPAGEDLDLATKPPQATFADTVGAAVEQWTTLKVKKIISEHCG